MPSAKKDEVKPADQQQKKDASQKEEGGGEESTSTGSASGSGSSISETASSSGSVAQKAVAKDEEGERKPQQPTDRARNLKSVALELNNGRRLYVDLRENEQGKLINMAVVAGRLAFSRQARVTRIAMPVELAKQFTDFLGEIGPKLDATQTPAAKTTEEEQGTSEKGAQQGQTRGAAIHSATLTANGDCKYELSLLPSLYKGREPVLQITSTIGKGARRTMNIESGELAQLKTTIEKLLRHADGQPGDDDGDHSEHDERDKKPAGAKQELLGRQTVVFGNRRFFFDPFKGTRGQSVRISNVYKRGMQVGRDSIVVPDKVLRAFAKILADYDVQMNGGSAKKEAEDRSSSSAASVSSSASSSASKGAEQQRKKKKKKKKGA